MNHQFNPILIRVVVATCAALVVLLAIAMSLAPPRKDQTKNPSRIRELSGGAKGAAWTAAKEQIAPLLHDPDSANFPWDSVSSTEIEPITVDGQLLERFIVSGVVRAKNKVGAIVAQRWEARVFSLKDTLIVCRIELNGKMVVSTRSDALVFSSLSK